MIRKEGRILHAVCITIEGRDGKKRKEVKELGNDSKRKGKVFDLEVVRKEGRV